MSQNLFVQTEDLQTAPAVDEGNHLYIYTQEGTMACVQSGLAELRFRVKTEIEDNAVTLYHRDDVRLTQDAVAALAVSLPNTLFADYEAYLSFLSAESGTAWSLSEPDNVTVSFRGADCDADSNTFTPRPNTVYELGLKCIGKDSDNRLIIAVRVGDVS